MGLQSCQHSERIQWMWKANEKVFDLTQEAEWTIYTDVDNQIIEQAYQKRMPEALLDQYHVNFEHLMQISNKDERQQRPVKRVTVDTSQQRLRKERFLAKPLTPSKPFSDSDCRDFFHATETHFNISSDWDENEEEVRMLVDKAAEGILIEGKLLGKQRQGEWLADQLVDVKDGPLEKITKKCARLYSLDSFLYRKLNEILRLTHDEQYGKLWKSKVSTLGPFAWFLANMKRTEDPRTSTIVYRGCNLSTEDIEEWKQLYKEHQTSGLKRCTFTSFTSTSRNRKKAEFMSENVLFIISICGYHDGRDISPFSNYDEEEFLLEPGFSMYISSCKYDENIQKWIIHVLSNQFTYHFGDMESRH